jgi:rhodanese-related sulfurtransferase
MVGGGQESAQRSGTENMAGVAALDAVLTALEQGGVFRGHDALCRYRERLADSLRAALPGVVFNAAFEHSLPTTLNFSVPGLASKELMDVFDAAGVRVSSGSACSAAKAAPSYVLQAMGVPHERAASAIRLSFGPLVDEATVAEACARIARCGEALRASGLLAAGGAPQELDGVLQLGSGGQCTWVVQDAASRGCVVIDPQPEFAERIEAHVRQQGYRVLAVLGTMQSANLDTLARAFALPQGSDAFGWPDAGAEMLTLGGQVLRRARVGTDQCAYLLGAAVASALPAASARYAFTGALAPQQLSGLIGEDTLLCAARDELQPCCSSLRAEQQALQADPSMHLDAGALQSLLQRHPDAVLVDVREHYEQAAGAHGLAGRPVLSVPLGQLASRIPGWLDGAPVPLVFFCRSGNRSAKAARCLRRLGYAQAYDLSGGIALAPLALAA